MRSNAAFRGGGVPEKGTRGPRGGRGALTKKNETLHPEVF